MLSWRLGGGWFPMCTLLYLYRRSIYGLIRTQLKKNFLRKLASDKGDAFNKPNLKSLIGQFLFIE